MGVGEVLVDPHGLSCCGGDDGQFDLGTEGWGTWRGRIHFPVIMHVTEAWLVWREGPANGIWICSAVDDVGGVAVDRVGWGVEGIGEV